MRFPDTDHANGLSCCHLQCVYTAQIRRWLPVPESQHCKLPSLPGILLLGLHSSGAPLPSSQLLPPMRRNCNLSPRVVLISCQADEPRSTVHRIGSPPRTGFGTLYSAVPLRIIPYSHVQIRSTGYRRLGFLGRREFVPPLPRSPRRPRWRVAVTSGACQAQTDLLWQPFSTDPPGRQRSWKS